MIDFETLINTAGLKLSQTIQQYQARISPSRDTDRPAEDHISKNTKKAAVLLLLYPKNETFHFVLTQRHDYKGTHGGQISLPGGKLEDSDNSLLHCAIRETYEEIGINLDKKHVFREMKSIYIPPSNFYVQPFLAIIDHGPTFVLEKREVKEIIEIPIYDLNNKNITQSEVTVINGNKIIAPHYLLNKKIVWGATGSILAELHALLDH